ncbi:MAG: glucose-6-phosphate isomerase [Lachnospiraceae bacterium]|nr:glucose-6-phosphate isomerase [Lachnospiraceae bacterium]
MKCLKLSIDKTSMDRVLERKEEGEIALSKLLKAKEKDMVGWLRLPKNIKDSDIKKIDNIAKEIRKNAKVLIVIGIGGSYLGAKAGVDFLSDYYKKEEDLEVVFVGNGLSEKYLYETAKYIEDKDFYINVISKSGGTLEPAVAFRYFRNIAIERYGKDAKKRIIATTDKKKGILKELSDKCGYRTFVVPDDVGGRYSVLTPVGLIPIAAAGFDIQKIIKGAKDMMLDVTKNDIKKNEAMQYAILRNVLYREGKDIEIFSTFKPNMRYFSEWLKQLFGESECKENMGIFPASLTFTADLHSMGQLMQEGKRNIFETFIDCEDECMKKLITIQKSDTDDDKLNYVKGKTVNELNIVAREATKKAHKTGDVPIIDISFKTQNEETLGALFYFFEMTCGISATILGVNPFNQPGVEEYKKNIKETLR